MIEQRAQDGQPSTDLAAALHDARAMALAGRTISARAHIRAFSNDPAVHEAMAWYGFQSGHAAEALLDAGIAVRLWHERGSPADEGRARAIHAWLCLEIGDGLAAAEGALEALRLCEACDDALALSWGLTVLGVTCWYARQLDQAIEYCTRAVSLARAVGDPVTLTWWLVNLSCAEHARALHAEGNRPPGPAGMDVCLAVAEEAVQAARIASDRWGESLALLNLADYNLTADRVEAAGACIAAMDAIGDIEGDRTIAHRHQIRGSVLLASDQPDAALTLFLQSLAISERIDNHDGILVGQQACATAYEHLGRFEQALAALKLAHRSEARLTAAHVQERTLMSTVLLGLDRLRTEIEDARIRRDEADRIIEIISIRAEGLAEETRRDPLTGIGNRRRFDHALSDLAGTSQQYALVLVDLDHFKIINDTWSHQTGDQVLRMVAARLSALARPSDTVTRYGGEEFALLMPDLDANAAARLCETMRAAIETTPMPATPGLSVTASFGIADRHEHPTAETDPATILSHADRRLYRAKSSGRNRIIWHDHSGA